MCGGGADGNQRLRRRGLEGAGLCPREEARPAHQCRDRLDGPFVGELTAAQRTFLEGELSQWDQAHRSVINIAGRNGLLQRRVAGVNVDLEGRQTTLKEMIGGITDVDMAQAISNLQAAQLSVQASAQALISMQQSSLLNFLK